MYFKLVKKAFDEFLNVEGVDYSIVDTDYYGDCNTCVNAELSEVYGEYSKGIFLKHWNEGMNADVPIKEKDELFIAHDITEEQADKLYEIFSNYFIVEPKAYNPSKCYVIKSKSSNLDDKLREIVRTEFENMELSNKFDNRARLYEICADIIEKKYDGVFFNCWDRLEEHIDEIIPEKLD